MDPRRLGIFRTVARAGSLTAGARRLGWTQPAVSQHVAALEREVGVLLLIRGPGGVVLTEAGEALLRHADAVDSHLEAARAELAEFTGPLGKLLADTAALTKELGARAKADPNEVGAPSVAYLRIVGHLVFAWLWTRMAALAVGRDDAFHRAKLATARFYLARLLPETRTCVETLRSGSKPLMHLDAALF